MGESAPRWAHSSLSRSKSDSDEPALEGRPPESRLRVLPPLEEYCDSGRSPWAVLNDSVSESWLSSLSTGVANQSQSYGTKVIGPDTDDDVGMRVVGLHCVPSQSIRDRPRS